MAFDQLRHSLCDDPILHPPSYDREFLLQTDASGRGIGAVVTQTDNNGTEHTEQEGLAVVDACSHFLPYLLGHPFKVITDH